MNGYIGPAAVEHVQPGTYWTKGERTVSSNEQGYQGWSNYATWGVALIIGNDEEMQNDVQLRAYDIATDESNEAPYVTMQDWLSDYVSDVCADWSDTQSMMVKQMLQAALAEVNWRELATTYINEAKIADS